MSFKWTGKLHSSGTSPWTLLNVRWESLFFDRVVETAANRGKLQAMSRFGGYVRKTARNSLKKVPKKLQKQAGDREVVSPPGHPPYNKTGFLRELIYYGYDRTNDSVVIGPELLNQKNASAYGASKGNTIPSVLEYGGGIRFFEHLNPNGQWYRSDLRYRISTGWGSAVGKPRRARLVWYAARPYMRPAFATTQTKLPEVWANCIK